MKSYGSCEGLVLDNGSQPLRVLAKPLGSPPAMGWKSRSALPGCTQAPLHYKAIACMGAGLPSPARDAFASRMSCLCRFLWKKCTGNGFFTDRLWQGSARLRGLGLTALQAT